MKNKRAISLIVLVVTIIVMVVIASAVILTLYSGNATKKTYWARITSDRASLQSQYATLLADMVASQNLEKETYPVLTIDDVRKDEEFKKWCKKVVTTNPRFIVYGDDESEAV